MIMVVIFTLIIFILCTAPINDVIDLNSRREFNFYRKTGIRHIVVSLAQSNLFCLLCKRGARPRARRVRARPGHFMLRRQGTPAELIKFCSRSKDEAREGLSILTVPRADISGAIR